MSNKKTLRLILGDQLNSNHSWFKRVDDSITYVMMEVRTETDYATHHIQKVVGFFVAMRNFAHDLAEKKHTILYIKLNDKNNQQSFNKNILLLLTKNSFTNFEYQLPDEYRLDKQLKEFCKTLTIENLAVDSEHFFSSRSELGDFFAGKKISSS